MDGQTNGVVCLWLEKGWVRGTVCGSVNKQTTDYIFYHIANGYTLDHATAISKLKSKHFWRPLV